MRGAVYILLSSAVGEVAQPQLSLGETHRTIEEIISSNNIVIFSNSECKESATVKELFEEYGASYAAYELDQRLDGKALAKTLAQPEYQPHANMVKKLGSTTVPAIFVRGRPVSSNTLKSSHKTGELEHWIE